MKDDLILIDSFTKSLPEDIRSFIESSLGDESLNKNKVKASWPAAFENLNIEKIIKNTHSSWIEKCLNDIEDVSIKKISELAARDIIGEENNFKSSDIRKWVFREYILNKLDSPPLISLGDDIREDIAYPLLKIEPRQTEDLIYILGLEDVGAAIKSSINSDKIKKVLNSIDHRFTDIFKRMIGTANLATTSSLGFDQLYFAASQKDGVKNIIISFGMLRLSLALYSASEQVRDIFFRNNDSKLYEYFLKVKGSKQQDKSATFVRGLLNAIVNLKGI